MLRRGPTPDVAKWKIDNLQPTLPTIAAAVRSFGTKSGTLIREPSLFGRFRLAESWKAGTVVWARRPYGAAIAGQLTIDELLPTRYDKIACWINPSEPLKSSAG